MEAYLQKEDIGYATIRGSTVDRAGQLQRFQEDPECKVFLGSLGAVGLGVDLTAASVVIHYDRWWNPAKENQATDRVHRIGQTRGVQVFKLVTLNTLEERIDQIIMEKGRLSEDIITSDETLEIKNELEITLKDHEENKYYLSKREYTFNGNWTLNILKISFR